MARYNEINVGHLNRFLQKHTGIKGAVPSPTLAPEIFPTLQMFNAQENRYLAGWYLYGGITIAAGGAGLFSGTQLRNPPLSNVVAVITRLFFRVNPALSNVSVSVGPIGIDLAGTGSGQPRSLDARGGNQGAASILSQTSSAGVGPLSFTFLQPQGAVLGQDYDVILDEDHQLPLLPGDGYRITSNTSNVPMTVNWLWRERFLEESERA